MELVEHPLRIHGYIQHADANAHCCKTNQNSDYAAAKTDKTKSRGSNDSCQTQNDAAADLSNKRRTAGQPDQAETSHAKEAKSDKRIG